MNRSFFYKNGALGSGEKLIATRYKSCSATLVLLLQDKWTERKNLTIYNSLKRNSICRDELCKLSRKSAATSIIQILSYPGLKNEEFFCITFFLLLILSVSSKLKRLNVVTSDSFFNNLIMCGADISISFTSYKFRIVFLAAKEYFLTNVNI